MNLALGAKSSEIMGIIMSPSGLPSVIEVSLLAVPEVAAKITALAPRFCILRDAKAKLHPWYPTPT